MRRPAASLLALLAALAAVLTACSSGAAKPPDWRPSPANPNVEGPGAVRITPIIPLPAPPGSGGGSGGSSSGGPAARKGDPDVVATHLVSPVGLAMLPDGTALVGERTTGRIVRVQPQPHRPVRTVRVLRGLDTRGDGGLLDLAVSPTFGEDGLVYAYVTTRTDDRVVEFTLHGPVTAVLTGIPKGTVDNAGRLMIGADGDLYVGTGDAGRSRLAERAHSLAGKVLRVTDIGRPAPGNPRHGSPVWASGQRVVDGLCTGVPGNAVWEVEMAPPGAADEVNVIDAGQYYGWPTPRSTERNPVDRLPANFGAPGGCAVAYGRLWVTSLDGQALLSAPIRRGGTPGLASAFAPVLQRKYGRLRTVVAAPDGALWLTTSNRDGHGHPVPADERVIRWIPGGRSLGGSSA